MKTRVSFALLALAPFLAPGRSGAQTADSRTVTVLFTPGSRSQDGYESASMDVQYRFLDCAGDIALHYQLDRGSLQAPRVYYFQGQRFDIGERFAPQTPGTIQFSGRVLLSSRQIGTFVDRTAGSYGGAGCVGQTKTFGPIRPFVGEKPTKARIDGVLQAMTLQVDIAPPLRNERIEAHLRSVIAERADAARRDAEQRAEAARRADRERVTAQREEQERAERVRREREERERAAGQTRGAEGTRSASPGVENAAPRQTEAQRQADREAELRRQAEERRQAEAERTARDREASEALRRQWQEEARRTVGGQDRSREELTAELATGIAAMIASNAESKRAEAERRAEIEWENRQAANAEAERRRAAAALRTAARKRVFSEKSGGIGVRAVQVGGQWYLQDVTPNGPAHAAGLRRGDRIIAVNELLAFGWSLEQLLLNLTGPSGSRLDIRINRGGFHSQRVQVQRAVTTPAIVAPLPLRCHEMVAPPDTLRVGEIISSHLNYLCWQHGYGPDGLGWMNYWSALSVDREQEIEIEVKTISPVRFTPIISIFSKEGGELATHVAGSNRGGRLRLTLGPGTYAVQVDAKGTNDSHGHFTLSAATRGLKLMKKVSENSRVIDVGYTGAIAPIQATVDRIEFTEFGPDWLTTDEPFYATVFDASTARVVETRLTINMPPVWEPGKAVVTCKASDASGTILASIDRTITRAEKELTPPATGGPVQVVLAFPFGSEKPGKWRPGIYHVSCWSNDRYLAAGAFEIARVPSGTAHRTVVAVPPLGGG